MKSLVIYYSKTGNNRYLAQKISDRLKSDSEEIVPMFNNSVFQMMFTFMKIGLGIKVKHTISDYDKLIIVGPVWAGHIVAPLYHIVSKYKREIKKVYFATCCGSDENSKNDKFGYMRVFNKIRELLGAKCKYCEAFPIGLALPEDQRKNGEAVMKTRLSDSNFKGELNKKFDEFIRKVTE